MTTAEPILSVRNLRKWFPVRRGIFSSLFQEQQYVKAVDDVSFDVAKGSSIAIAGESGCGKTTLARTILRLTHPTDGAVYYEGQNIFEMNRIELSEMRLRMQLIFQNPFEVLDPRHTVEDLVGEGLVIHQIEESDEVLHDRVIKALEDVRLIPAEQFATRYIHELSGGQLQRIAIARSLILNPNLIIADEPVSMLDASIRTEVMNLMTDLQKEKDLTYIFITHDLAQARYVGEYLIIMYLGKIAEMGPMEEVIQNPQHPYTKALVSNIPIPDPTEKRERIMLPGETPTPIDLPPGCRFKDRCQEFGPQCKPEEPELVEVAPNHFVACYLKYAAQ
ncbi:MAG: peptide ABC transporter substrate-binding protein [Candidatus Thorarchaeota archaeon]|nr:MAG: peptide ABC transporter substrate-binding protein [Candidatus Thorarchaeota archaeon]